MPYNFRALGRAAAALIQGSDEPRLGAELRLLLFKGAHGAVEGSVDLAESNREINCLSPLVVSHFTFFRPACGPCVTESRSREKVASDASRAGGITRQPSARKRQALTVWPSRRKATSHRIVASDPVTDRLGPRSTPMSTAPVSSGDACAPPATVPAINPSGRLLTTLHSTATRLPAPSDASFGIAPPRPEGSQAISDPDHSRAFDRLHQHEEPGDQGQHAPGNVPDEGPRR